MIHIKSIELVDFKGVSRLSCDFEDLTVLAGLNNSGKTTILQATYLLLSSLPRIAAHQHIEHENIQVRSISLNDALSPLGVRDNIWLSSIHASDVEGKIIGVFPNSLRVELGVIRHSGSNFVFTLSQLPASPQRKPRDLLAEVSKLSAAILTPPGEVPSREDMVSGDQYRHLLGQGKGAQLWRNGIWWGIQTDGFESFAPVQQQISRYFPDIELLLPTLSTSGTPEILIKYRESGNGLLDIAQSGAGLRTFISLTRILEQSPSPVILLDEPDAHLHASQQAVVLDLMFDAASKMGRQVIIASHSPEIISRVPSECIRWIERGTATAQGGEEVGCMLERLGATPDIYIPWADVPDVLVYVEGIKDRPVVEGLIRWCRSRSEAALPTTLVIPHKDGRFEEPTLQGIARVLKECVGARRIVGIRDRDWYYDRLPAETPEVSPGDGWHLITLPCKEAENLLCDPDVLYDAYEGKLPKETLQAIIDEESRAPDLVDEWRYQVRHRVRDRLPQSYDPSTREREADELFAAWSNDPATRRRLVAGKSLFGRIRNRVRRDHSLSFPPGRILNSLSSLPAGLQVIATLIFPTGSEG